MYIILIVIIILLIFKDKIKQKIVSRSSSSPSSSDSVNDKNSEYDYTKSYTSKWLFSYNEKAAYQKIKEQADKKGFFVFAKVRLLDLVEPKKGIKNYKGAMWKIQAKHVDFVICNEKLVPIGIIELDDSTHDSADRLERDNFVDEVLKNTGYKIIYQRNYRKYTG